MKIFITGGGGFVGSHLAEAELNRGNQVTILDISPPTKVKELLDNPNFIYIQGDIMQAEVLEPLIADCDLLYHFAAIADPKVYCERPHDVLRLDLEGTQLAIKLAYKHHKKIVFASTSEVYGKNPKVPWKEEDDRVLGSTTLPRWSYSTSKAIGEHYCHAFGKLGLKYVILRFFNFYGPKLDFIGQGRVMTCFLDNFLMGGWVEVVEPGNQTRCFTYISDGVEGIVRAAHTPEAEGLTFNLGLPVETSMIDLAQIMKKIGGFNNEIIIITCEKKYGKGYDDIFRRVPDVKRAKEILNWEAAVCLEDGLRMTIDYFKNNHNKI